MKQKILAFCLLLAIISFVIANTIILQKTTDKMMDKIDQITVTDRLAHEQLNKAEKYFKKAERYISLTVSHDDLTNIEDCFAELSGYLSVGDVNGAEVTKCRLISFLSHLRRLIGFNIDAII